MSTSVETTTCEKCGTIWELAPCGVCIERYNAGKPLPHSYQQHGTCLVCQNPDLLIERDRVSRGRMLRERWNGEAIA